MTHLTHLRSENRHHPGQAPSAHGSCQQSEFTSALALWCSRLPLTQGCPLSPGPAPQPRHFSMDREQSFCRDRVSPSRQGHAPTDPHRVRVSRFLCLSQSSTLSPPRSLPASAITSSRKPSFVLELPPCTVMIGCTVGDSWRPCVSGDGGKSYLSLRPPHSHGVLHMAGAGPRKALRVNG